MISRGSRSKYEVRMHLHLAFQIVSWDGPHCGLPLTVFRFNLQYLGRRGAEAEASAQNESGSGNILPLALYQIRGRHARPATCFLSRGLAPLSLSPLSDPSRDLPNGGMLHGVRWVGYVHPVGCLGLVLYSIFWRNPTHTQHYSVMDRTVQLSFFNFSCHHPELLPTLRVSRIRYKFFFAGFSSVDSDLQGASLCFFLIMVFVISALPLPPCSHFFVAFISYLWRAWALGRHRTSLFVLVFLFCFDYLGVVGVLLYAHFLDHSRILIFARIEVHPIPYSDSQQHNPRACGTNAHTLLANKHFTVR